MNQLKSYLSFLFYVSMLLLFFGCPTIDNFEPSEGDPTGDGGNGFGFPCPPNFELDNNEQCICPSGSVRFNNEGCIIWTDTTYLYSDLSNCIGDAALLVKFGREIKYHVNHNGIQFESLDMLGAEPNYSGGWIPSGGGEYLRYRRDNQPDSIIWQMPMDALYSGQNILPENELRGIFMNWSGVEVSENLYIGNVKLGHYDISFPWALIDVFSECPDTLMLVEL